MMKDKKIQPGIVAKVMQIGMKDNPDMSILKDLKNKYSELPDGLKEKLGKKEDEMEFSSEEVTQLIKALLGVKKDPKECDMEMGEF